MGIDCEIVILHETPVSMDALREAIEFISTCSERAALQLLDSAIFQDLDLPSEFFKMAIQTVEEETAHAFWLHSVEAGSSKFSGSIRKYVVLLVIGTISKFGGNIAFDVVKDTENYQRIQPHLVEMTDQYTNLFVEHARTLASERTPEEQIMVDIEIVGDRLRMTVRPSRKQYQTISVA